jgi:long-chain fatty acid transport protein
MQVLYICPLTNSFLQYLMLKHLALATLVGIAGFTPVFGSGYQVSLQGQKQIGMGHTGTGLALDASSLFFNPGSLSYLKKNQILVGASFISSKFAYLAPGPGAKQVNTENPLSTPFAVYASFLIPKTDFSFGVAAYTPYGSTIKWPTGWTGNGLLQELSLAAVCIQPTVGYKITEEIGIGAGFVYMLGSVNLKRGAPALYSNNGFGSVELDGQANGIGFNAGVYIKPTKEFSIGLTYRSQIDAKIEEGDATYSGPSVVRDGVTFPKTGATKFAATLPLPGVASIGIGYQVNEELLLAADFNYTFWSAYKSLDFTFDSAFGGDLKTSSPRNYDDAFAVRLGANYNVTKQFAIRLGGYYDQTPVQDGYMTPETPDADRFSITGGIGFMPIENLSIDASINFILGQKREQTIQQAQNAGTYPSAPATMIDQVVLPGTYQQRAIIPGISIGYSF